MMELEHESDSDWSSDDNDCVGTKHPKKGAYPGCSQVYHGLYEALKINKYGEDKFCVITNKWYCTLCRLHHFFCNTYCYCALKGKLYLRSDEECVRCHACNKVQFVDDPLCEDLCCFERAMLSQGASSGLYPCPGCGGKVCGPCFFQRPNAPCAKCSAAFCQKCYDEKRGMANEEASRKDKLFSNICKDCYSKNTN